MPTPTFAASQKYIAKHPDTLAVYCSDGRFTAAVEDLAAHLGHPRIDTLTMPGGAALLDLRSAAFSDVDATTRAASFLVRGHKITHVLLLAHAGCGYYRARHPSDTPERARERQIADLAAAVGWFNRLDRALDVTAYYVRPEGERIVFDALDAGRA